MGNLNPYYNESFIFIVEQEQLRVGELKLFTINEISSVKRRQVLKKLRILIDSFMLLQYRLYIISKSIKFIACVSFHQLSLNPLRAFIVLLIIIFTIYT